MNIRVYEDKDYPMITKWWEAQGWPILPEAALPAVGFIVEEDEVGLCAGFVYRTDSAFALFEWIVGNPEADKDKRREGLDLLIKTASLYIKEEGFSLVLTMTKHPSFITRLENHGFQETDHGMTHLVKGV